jgi:hypothetical protein
VSLCVRVFVCVPGVSSDGQTVKGTVIMFKNVVRRRIRTSLMCSSEQSADQGCS